MSGRLAMTAAVARTPGGPFTIEAAEIEPPRPGEVRVRIKGVGLCHTDLITRDQFIPIPLPAVLGHEGAGIVESVGEGVRKVAPGDAVVMSFASCGACRQCRHDLPSYCTSFPAFNYSGARPDGSSGVWIDGEPVSAHFFGQSSFASYALAYERNVVKVDASDDLHLLGPLGCGFQTGAGAVMRSMRCPAGSSLAIFGAGPVGLAAVMGAKIQGVATVIVVEPLQPRRELALRLGATHVIDPTSDQAAEAIRRVLPSGVEYALETSGREAVVEVALGALTSHGLLALVGVPPKPESSVAINLAALITYGHRIVGVIEGDSDLDTFIPRLLRHTKCGEFPIDELIKSYPFSEINKAIADQILGICCKAVLIP